jgi:hypothetical protein
MWTILESLVDCRLLFAVLLYSPILNEHKLDGKGAY